MNQLINESFKFIKYWPFVIAICMGLGGFGIYRMVNSDPEVNSPSNQTTATISRGDIEISAFGSGSLIPAIEVELGFENSGIVEEILVETGDHVEEGQLLVRLDDEALQEALDGFIPMAQSLERQLQTIAAIIECTDEQFLTEAIKETIEELGDRTKVQERLNQLKAVVDG